MEFPLRQVWHVRLREMPRPLAIRSRLLLLPRHHPSIRSCRPPQETAISYPSRQRMTATRITMLLGSMWMRWVGLRPFPLAYQELAACGPCLPERARRCRSSSGLTHGTRRQETRLPPVLRISWWLAIPKDKTGTPPRLCALTQPTLAAMQQTRGAKVAATRGQKSKLATLLRAVEGNATRGASAAPDEDGPAMSGGLFVFDVKP
jgi:hypothetical protein